MIFRESNCGISPIKVAFTIPPPPLYHIYRYAVKLMYDEVSIGEVDDFSELAEYLESYNTDYFIGLESEKYWEEAIAEEVPYLFSIGRDTEKVRITPPNNTITVKPPIMDPLIRGQPLYKGHWLWHRLTLL